MTARRKGSPDRARLLTLLRVRSDEVGAFSFATDETLGVARALGPEVAGEAVSTVLDGYAPGGDHAFAQRAAHVAHELALDRAIPALVACIARLPDGDPVASCAGASLGIIGSAAIDPLADALSRATHPDARFALGMALTHLPAGDGRVRASLERMLDVDPGAAALLLGHLGDREALPALRATLDRLALPPGAGAPEAADVIVTVGEAILVLAGGLSRPQRAKFERACALADEAGLAGPAESRLH